MCAPQAVLELGRPPIAWVLLQMVENSSRTPGRVRRLLVATGTLACFFGLSVLLYLPAGPLSQSRLPSGGFNDPPQLAWFLAWLPFALGHPSNLLHTTYLEYPGGINLAANTAVPLLGLLAAPVTLSLGPIAAVNLLLHLAFTLSAGAMYFVLRAWRLHPVAAFAGGLLYGFSPYMVAEANLNAHVDLVFVPLLPVLVFLAAELVIHERRSPVRIGGLLGLVAACQVYIDPELLLQLGVVLGFGLVGLAIAYRAEARKRLGSIGKGLATSVAVFAPLVSPYALASLLAPGHLSGPVQQASLLQAFRADLLGAVLPTSEQLLAPSPLAARADQFVAGNVTENGSYLGVPLVLLLVLIAVLLRRHLLVRLAAALCFLAYVCSLGSYLTFDAHATPVPLLGWLTMRIPVLDNFLPARFALLVTLFAAILVAAALDRALGRSLHAPRRAVRLGGLGAAGALSCLVLLPRAPLSTEPLPWPATLTSTIDTIPPGSAVLTYPFPITPWSGPMLWQAMDALRFRLVGGYATVRTSGGVGTTGPPLLEPAGVQEFLLSEQEGASSYYPQPPNPYPARESDLCSFVHRYSIGAVVYWGLPSTPVWQYFSSALGAPSVGENSVFVWLRAGRCRA